MRMLFRLVVVAALALVAVNDSGLIYAAGPTAKKIPKKPPATVASRLEQVGAAARLRMKPHFDLAGIAYPPARTWLIALKTERRLQLYAAGADGKKKYICEYPISAVSGKPGPKLREGDMQVPEGLYRVTFLNPQSVFHLSLALDYPNAFDRAKAKADRRRNLGSEIMIHGSWYSEGCVALGDTAIEDLFVLTADAGISAVRVIIAPVDFRKRELAKDKMTTATHPAWSTELYDELRAELKGLDDQDTTQPKLIAYADATPPAPMARAEAKGVLLDLFLQALVAAAEDASTTATHGAK